MTEEERQAAASKQSLSQKEHWSAITLEERRELRTLQIERMASGREEYYDAMTEAERHRRSNNISSGLQAYYDTLTPEEYAQCIRKWQEAGYKALFSKHTSKPEKLFDTLLEAQGIAYIKPIEPIRVNGKSYWPDFILENMVIIEFNGCYTHQCEECGHNNGYYNKQRQFTAKDIRERDRQRTEALESLGYIVKVIWEHELPKFNDWYTTNLG
jgi:G:T-mismatch repair DNA endonuclease (very short patch repair protein)